MAAPSTELANRISGGIVTSGTLSSRGRVQALPFRNLGLFILYSECRPGIEDVRSLTDFPSKGSIPRNPGRGHA